MESVRLDLIILYCGSNRMYMFATKGKDYFLCPSGFDRVLKLIIFVILIGDYLSSPRSGELADFTWGKVGPCNSRFTK